MSDCALDVVALKDQAMPRCSITVNGSVLVDITTEKPEWEYFIGNQHNWINTNTKMGGGVSFSRHLGKPLSDGLWDDLVFRLDVQKIRIFKPNMAEWSDSRSNMAAIYLDENEKVSEIIYYP